MTLKKYKFFLYGFLFCYFLAGLAAGFTESGEIFPLFSGHWFYQTPAEFNDYGILIYSLDGQNFENPMYLEQAYHRFPVWPFAAYGAVQRWGKSVNDNRDDREEQKAAVKRLIFGPRPYKIQLVKRRFNSIEFLKSGHVQNVKVLLDVEN